MPVVIPFVPTHGVVLVVWGTVSIGLTPPELISVDPNGIPVGRTVDPVVPREGTTPPPEIAVVEPVVQPDAELIVPLMLFDTPPALVPPKTGLPQPPGMGLKPPGLISVAPNGIPVPVDPSAGNVVPVAPIIPVEPLMPGMPRGEVAPIPEGGITLCACSGLHPSKTTVAIANAARTASPPPCVPSKPNMRTRAAARD